MNAIYRILLSTKNSFVVKASCAMVGIYAGYLFWYMFHQFFSGAADHYGLIVTVISLGIDIFIAIYNLPGQLCNNYCIKNILFYPIPVRIILITLLGRMFALQLGICMALTYPQFIFKNSWSAMENILASMVVISAMDFVIVLCVVVISRIFSNKIVGYAFAMFQYVSILLVVVLVGNIIALGLTQPDFLLWINERVTLANIFLFAVPFTVLLGIAMTIVFKYWYIRGYLNVQSFYKQVAKKHGSIIRIGHPYFLVEWKRVLQNKELLFFSSFKSVLTVIALCHLLVTNLGQIALGEKYVIELFLLVACCGTNTISSTAYSSDYNREYYAFLPVSPRRMFLWKTILGFLWGEAMILFFGLVIIVLDNIPVLDFFLLFIYGTSMNYACSWFGVFLDLKMPRTVNSTNELLHGNISKVIVLIVAMAITIGNFYLVGNHMLSVPLLPFLIIINVFIVSAELCYWFVCKGAFDDTNK
ncbi:MAG: hypothetical protein K2N63_13245 [Lachnospiraceae bacterium]|nr:hypothetical protein [Lachnospiraceae bacterium]